MHEDLLFSPDWRSREAVKGWYSCSTCTSTLHLTSSLCSTLLSTWTLSSWLQDSCSYTSWPVAAFQEGRKGQGKDKHIVKSLSFFFLNWGNSSFPGRLTQQMSPFDGLGWSQGPLNDTEKSGFPWLNTLLPWVKLWLCLEGRRGGQTLVN